jgi:hypothetical protein
MSRINGKTLKYAGSALLINASLIICNAFFMLAVIIFLAWLFPVAEQLPTPAESRLTPFGMAIANFMATHLNSIFASILAAYAIVITYGETRKWQKLGVGEDAKVKELRDSPLLPFATLFLLVWFCVQ